MFLCSMNFISLTQIFLKFQRLAPTWLDLAKAMEFNEEIAIAKIDCTEFRGVCSIHDVKGYPTLLWFENGQKVNLIIYLNKKIYVDTWTN